MDFDKCTLTDDACTNFHRRGLSTVYNAILLAARLLHQQGTEVYGKSDLFEAFLSVEVDEDTGDDRTGELGSLQKGTQTLA